jgi:hypothetical protein
MTHLLTTIGSCPLLTTVVGTPKPQRYPASPVTIGIATVARGGAGHGATGPYADDIGACATASIFGSGEPDPIRNWLRSTGVRPAVVLQRKRLPSSSSTCAYIEVYRKQQRRLKEIKSNET